MAKISKKIQIHDVCKIVMALNRNLDEYVMLRMYEENIIKRGFLLRMPFVTLEQIESDSWKYPISKEEKPEVRTMIQVDIISKIMMYIEDLAILCESLMCQRDYYSYLTDESIDLGYVVGNFIKRLDQLSYDEICKVMSYVNASGSRDYDKLLRKQIDYHVDKMKNKLMEIKDFSSDANHSIYKRFKHAGIPIISGFPVHFAASDPLRQFDSFNIVSIGIDPLKDIVIVPYSSHLIHKYENLISILQEVLRELVSNRKVCLERDIQRMIPIQYNKDLFSPQEIESMNTEIDLFYNNHPIKKRPKSINTDLNGTTYKNILEKIHWYLVSDHLSRLIYFGGISLTLVSIGLSLIAFKVRRWSVVPNVQTLITDYTTVPYSKVLQRNAGEMAKAVVTSETQNNSKGKLIEWSWYLLISGLVIVFLSIIIFTTESGMNI